MIPEYRSEAALFVEAVKLYATDARAHSQGKRGIKGGDPATGEPLIDDKGEAWRDWQGNRELLEHLCVTFGVEREDYPDVLQYVDQVVKNGLRSVEAQARVLKKQSRVEEEL